MSNASTVQDYGRLLAEATHNGYITTTNGEMDAEETALDMLHRIGTLADNIIDNTPSPDNVIALIRALLPAAQGNNCGAFPPNSKALAAVVDMLTCYIYIAGATPELYAVARASSEMEAQWAKNN